MKKQSKYLILSGAIFLIGISYWLITKLSRFNTQLVYQSNLEAEKWIPYNELDEETALIIQDYWKRGINIDVPTNVILTESWQDQYAWSGVFISWLMRVSGAGDNFPYSATHSEYIIETTNNRNNNEGVFKAYDISEKKPKVSDLVCRNRGNTNASYNNVSQGDQLHCDIVTKVNKNSITIIGGNVNNKVSESELETNSSGFITNPNYFTIIKNNL